MATTNVHLGSMTEHEMDQHMLSNYVGPGAYTEDQMRGINRKWRSLRKKVMYGAAVGRVQ